MSTFPSPIHLSCGIQGAFTGETPKKYSGVGGKEFPEIVKYLLDTAATGSKIVGFPFHPSPENLEIARKILDIGVSIKTFDYNFSDDEYNYDEIMGEEREGRKKNTQRVLSFYLIDDLVGVVCGYLLWRM